VIGRASIGRRGAWEDGRWRTGPLEDWWRYLVYMWKYSRALLRGGLCMEVYRVMARREGSRCDGACDVVVGGGGGGDGMGGRARVVGFVVLGPGDKGYANHGDENAQALVPTDGFV